ncbi:MULTISPECIES: S49 family peptidase [unclassified Methylobacterium]|uniref:S49 family peptidase n=1 Tax=unclassified Methylobacterium TaxID=2615210 RepID=UPI0011C1EF24|nr:MULTISPECIES: S49 family peptidase [unclassified Methylobacterium]QEE38395.1 S49 family peptidase [Methylobacterium sp. WL1]TXN55384.1 S49 family peptidase [Methylobacterium sp. WL2]
MPFALPDALRAFLPRRFRDRRPRVAVVRLSGTIGAVSPIRPGLSIGGVAGSLERAFTMPGIKAVAIVINSPGGAPAQSHLIHRRIRALADEKKLPVVAFVEDVAASGGYMIACAADEIVADPTSIVGSIGVVSAGFGFQGLLEKIGIERRVHTQGEAKSMLDPFRPEDPADVARLKRLQADIQDLFTGLVTSRRPTLSTSENLFTGAVWTGRQAVGLGLVDALGDIRSTMRARFGDTVDLRLVAEARGGFLSRLLRRGGAPVGIAEEAVAALEERAAFARFGL